MISIRKVQKSRTAKGLMAMPGAVPAELVVPGAPRHRLFQMTQKVDYGLFLLIELAKKKAHEPVSLRVIADVHHMSFFFLQKVAADLKKVGIIQASRGKNGGYVLAQKPARLTLKDILEALEGPIAVMGCLDHGSEEQNCVREGWCGMRKGLALVNQILMNTLTQTTLHHLLKPTWKKAV